MCVSVLAFLQFFLTFLPSRTIHKPVLFYFKCQIYCLPVIWELSKHVSFFVFKVVVKTRTEFQTEKKRLRVPKVEEFTISFTDGVSERLKVKYSSFARKFYQYIFFHLLGLIRSPCCFIKIIVNPCEHENQISVSVAWDKQTEIVKRLKATHFFEQADDSVNFYWLVTVLSCSITVEECLNIVASVFIIYSLSIGKILLEHLNSQG